MSSPAVLDHMAGYREGQEALKRKYPMIPRAVQKRIRQSLCSVCCGRGLLSLPCGDVKNQKGVAVASITEHYFVCPDCRGWGVALVMLDLALSEQVKVISQGAAA